MTGSMKRWSRAAALALVVPVLAGACAGTPGVVTPAVPAAGLPVDPPRRPGMPLLLIAMPSSAPFQATRHGLVSEIERNFDVSTFIVTPQTSERELSDAIDRAAPACIVLMNNTSVKLYRDYQQAHRGDRMRPVVVAMTSFLEDLRKDLENATGISYEVPGVTAFVALRSIIRTPVSRVGVIYPKHALGFVERQKALAAKEGIKLVGAEVSAEPAAPEIQGAFARLKSEGVDVLWVLNDNRLLRDGAFLNQVWRPGIEALDVPVVVGAEPLLKSVPIGTFAVLPDHLALGTQAANLILDLSDTGWHAGQHPIELPLSTINVLNVRAARAKFGLRDGALDRIDQACEP